MNFNITTKAETPQYFDVYIVECVAMFGDADGNETVIAGGFKRNKEEELLAEFINVCEKMKNEYPHGRGGGGQDEYYHVEGFYKWFDVENTHDGIDDNERSYDLGVIWPYDMYCDCQGSFDSYKVFYYDALGNKFNVEVVK